MKKPVEKRLVQFYADKDWFMTKGGKNWILKTWFYFIPAIVILVWFTGKPNDKILNLVCAAIACVLYFGWFLFAYYIKGKKFWKENKDKQEPIFIERSPDMWGRKRTWDENEKGN
jgi:undecaprenyl pyrophosphate phosphatase UppP